MPKLSYMLFYPADYINDTRALSAEAKGCWMDLLCFMWNAPERGVWTGTYQEFARVTGTPWEVAPRLIQELGKVGTVTMRDNLVTVINRRMVKQEIHYKSNANRQARFRSNALSNAKVTDKTLDSSRLLKTTKDNTPITSPRSEVRDLVDYFHFKLTEKLGEKPSGFSGGALGKMLKAAISNHPAIEIRTRIDHWFKSTEPFIVRNGYKETLFTSRFPLLKDGPIHGPNEQRSSNAPNGGTSISVQVARLRAKKEIEGLREVPSAGEILTRVRDLPNVQPET